VRFDNASPDDGVGSPGQVLDAGADGLATSGAPGAAAHKNQYENDGGSDNCLRLQQNPVGPLPMRNAHLVPRSVSQLVGFLRPPAIIGSHPESRPIRPSVVRAIS